MNLYLRGATKEAVENALVQSGLCVVINGALVAVDGDIYVIGNRITTTRYQPTDPREPLPPPTVDDRWFVNLRTNVDPSPEVLASLPLIWPETPDAVFG